MRTATRTVAKTGRPRKGHPLGTSRDVTRLVRLGLEERTALAAAHRLAAVPATMPPVAVLYSPGSHLLVSAASRLVSCRHIDNVCV